MNVGIFGGSFDPIHLGHLIIAEHVCEKFALDRILFVPAAQSPHKPKPPLATSKQRIEMLKLAIGAHPVFEVSTIETDRGEISFTVDTLDELLEKHPEYKLHLLLGVDAIQQFDRWRQPEKILEQCQLIVCHRGGFDDPDFTAVEKVATNDQLNLIKQNVARCPLIEISSSDIRDRVANSRSIRFLTPRAVEKYIETNRIYAQSRIEG